MSEELQDTVGKIIAVARDKYTVHECNECTWRKCCELKFDSAECREVREDIFLSLGIEDGYFSDLLNRIEAAYKREMGDVLDMARNALDCLWKMSQLSSPAAKRVYKQLTDGLGRPASEAPAE